MIQEAAQVTKQEARNCPDYNLQRYPFMHVLSPTHGAVAHPSGQVRANDRRLSRHVSFGSFSSLPAAIAPLSAPATRSDWCSPRNATKREPSSKSRGRRVSLARGFPATTLIGLQALNLLSSNQQGPNPSEQHPGATPLPFLPCRPNPRSILKRLRSTHLLYTWYSIPGAFLAPACRATELTPNSCQSIRSKQSSRSEQRECCADPDSGTSMPSLS